MISNIRYYIISLLMIFISTAALATDSFAEPNDEPDPKEIISRLKSMSVPSKLIIPVEDIESSELKDTWGASRSSGRTHEGIDIIAPRGARVFSATEGIVSSMKDSNLGGKNIWILGPGGAWHYYAHLDAHRDDLQVGDYVNEGDLIGYVGNTGNARHTSPHLHYGLYLSGKGSGPVNPYPYLR